MAPVPYDPTKPIGLGAAMSMVQRGLPLVGIARGRIPDGETKLCDHAHGA